MLIVLFAILTVIKKTIENLSGRGKDCKLGSTTIDTFPVDTNGQRKNPSTSITDHQHHTTMNKSADSNIGAADEQNESSTSGLTVITFNGNEAPNCFSISSKTVQIIGSDGKHNHGSSQVKLKNVVDYKWDIKNHPGHLIAVHIDGNCIAYAIKVNNKNGAMEGMVRVFYVDQNLRTLIKGLSGEVLDLQFAHNEQERILASIDAQSLFVHKIDMFNGNLLCEMIIKIEDPLRDYSPKFDKISWCPFIDATSDNDDSQLIVWARGSIFQCFNVKVIVSKHGVGKFQVKSLSEGYLKYQDNSIIISWVALSPDASTLGVGSTDGIIRFFQIYMHDSERRCLHQWNPHKGKAISSFFFLDDLTNRSSEAYWKYALTGAANNTEIKIWDCSTWECLQTLSINCSAVEDHKSGLHFIAEMSRSSEYLVLSCFETRTAYVFQLDNCAAIAAAAAENNDTNTSQDSRISTQTTKPLVYVKNVAEFAMNSVMLSYSIVDAAVRRYKCGNDDSYFFEEMDDFDDETNSIVCVVVRMFIVQPKSLQECRILYQPSVPDTSEVKSTLSTFETNNFSKSSDSSINEKNTKQVNGNDNENNEEMYNSDSSDKQDEVPIVEHENQDNSHKKTVDNNEHENEQINGIEIIDNDKKEINVLETLLNKASANSVASVSPNSTSNVKEENTEINSCSSPQAGGSKQSRYGQLNLMTPDAFTCPDKTPEGVSSAVLNTILMLAGVPGQKTNAAGKNADLSRLNLINNKVLEEQEQQKQKQALESQKKFIAAIDNSVERTVVDTGLASGASSPSREVREIMSLQEYDKSSYSGDELLETTEADTENNTSSKSNKSDKSTGDHWPKGSTQNKHSTELQNAANLISQAVHASSSSNLNCLPPTFGNATNSNSAPTTSSASAMGTVNCSNAELSAINAKMGHLIELVKLQSMQINALQTEIADIKKCNPMASAKNMSEFSFKLEMQLSKLLEQYLKRLENEHKKKLSAFMAGRDVQNRELREMYIQILNQYLLTQVGEIMSKVITIEIQRQISPLLSAKMDSLHKQIQLDVTQKLTSFDLMLSDNISQVCKSKNIIETFGKSVLLGVQNSLQAAFIESMSTTLIPAYEKSSQNMFTQLHDAFSVGIREFMHQLDSYMQNLKPVKASNDDMREKFVALRLNFETIMNKHRNALNDSMLETRKDVKNMEIVLSRQIQDTVKTEMRKCFENQTVALRSQANTPAPAMYDMRESVRNFLQQGHINKAFHQALLANDLSLVEYTLKHADHNTVFNPQCCLEQKVLLSLIQQISADMSNHNEIKQNYLSEALLAIDYNDPITREHAPKVLQELYRSCQMFLMNQPKSSQCSNVRMLLKAIQGFKDQF